MATENNKQQAHQQVSEQQLMQMAQQEENTLMNKQVMLEKLTTVLRETLVAKEALKELQKSNGKLMVNLGATVMIEVEAKNLKNCKRGMSENAYKEETVTETEKWLTTREEKLQAQIKKLSEEYTQNEQRLNNIVGILKQIDAEKRKMKAQAKVPTISK
ncbi:MAG: hypothetical protein WC821_02520 [archaeon]|jgi:prefoldin subunit 5